MITLTPRNITAKTMKMITATHSTPCDTSPIAGPFKNGLKYTAHTIAIIVRTA